MHVNLKMKSVQNVFGGKPASKLVSSEDHVNSGSVPNHGGAIDMPVANQDRQHSRPSVPTFPVETMQHNAGDLQRNEQSRSKLDPKQSLQQQQFAVGDHESVENIPPNSYAYRQLPRNNGRLSAPEEPFDAIKNKQSFIEPSYEQPDDHFISADSRGFDPDFLDQIDTLKLDNDYRAGPLIEPRPIEFDYSRPRQKLSVENPEQQQVVPARLGQGLALARPLKTPAGGIQNVRTAFQQTPSPPQQPSQHTTSSDFLRCSEQVNIATPVLPTTAVQQQKPVARAIGSFAQSPRYGALASQPAHHSTVTKSIFEQVGANTGNDIDESRQRRQQVPAAQLPKPEQARKVKEDIEQDDMPSTAFIQPQLRRHNTVAAFASPALGAIGKKHEPACALSPGQDAVTRTNQFLSRRHEAQAHNNVVGPSGADMITFASGGRNELHYLQNHPRSSSQYHLSPGLRSKSMNRGIQDNILKQIDDPNEDANDDEDMRDDAAGVHSKAPRGPSQSHRNGFKQTHSSNNSPPQFNVADSSRRHRRHRMYASGSRHNKPPTTPPQHIQMSKDKPFKKSGIYFEVNCKIHIHSLSQRRRRGDRGDSSHRTRSDIKSGARPAGARGLTSQGKLQDRRGQGRHLEDDVSPVRGLRIADVDDSDASPRATIDQGHVSKRQKIHHTPVQTAQPQSANYAAAFPFHAPAGAANYWPMFFPPNQGNTSNSKQTQACTVQRTPPRKESSGSQVPRMLPSTLSCPDYETMVALWHQQQQYAYYMSSWHQHMVQHQARDESSSPSQPSGSRQTKTKTVAGGNAKEGYSSSKKSKVGKTSSAVSDDDDEDGEDESQDESSAMYQNGMMPPMHPYGFYPPPWLHAYCPPLNMSPLKFCHENGAFYLQNCLPACSSSSKSQLSKMAGANQQHQRSIQFDEIIPEQSPSKLCRSESQRRRYQGIRSGDRGRPDDRSSIKQRPPSDAHETSQAKLGAPIGCSPQHTGRMYRLQMQMDSEDSQKSSSTEQQCHAHHNMHSWQCNAAHVLPWHPYMRPASDQKQQVPLMLAPPPFGFAPPGAWPANGQNCPPWSSEQMNKSAEPNSSSHRDDEELFIRQNDSQFNAAVTPIMGGKDSVAAEESRLASKSNEKATAQKDDVSQVEERAGASVKKDAAKSGTKSQRTGAANRGTATKRSKPFETAVKAPAAEQADKQSNKKQIAGGGETDIVAQSTTKKRVQKANKKDAMAQQSTPSKKNRSRTAHKGSPGQRAKMDDYDHTFDRPDDLNKSTTQKCKALKKCGNGTDAAFFQITPPKQDGQQLMPATADRHQDRRLLAVNQGAHDQRSQMVTKQPQQDGAYNGLDGATSLNMPSFAGPDESQHPSAQTDELEDVHQIPILIQQDVQNGTQQFIETCPVSGDNLQDGDSWWNVKNAMMVDTSGVITATNGVESGASNSLSNIMGFGTTVHIQASDNMSNLATGTAQKKNKRRPRKHAGTVEGSELNQQNYCESRLGATQAPSVDEVHGGSSVCQQKKLNAQQREDAQRLNDEKIQLQTDKVLEQTLTQSQLFARIAEGKPTVTRCKGCKCKKGHCLKRYCECLRNNATCGADCGCRKHDTCRNMPGPEYTKDRRDAIMEILRRKFDAFEPKVDSSNAHASGCNCKNSKCLKGYCECYERKVPCTEKCKCIGCRNPLGCRTGATGNGSMPITTLSMTDAIEMDERGDTHLVQEAEMSAMNQQLDGSNCFQRQQEDKVMTGGSTGTAIVTPPPSLHMQQQQSASQAPFVVNRLTKKQRSQTEAPSNLASTTQLDQQDQGINDQIQQVNVLKAYCEADESMQLIKLEDVNEVVNECKDQQHRRDVAMKEEQEQEPPADKEEVKDNSAVITEPVNNKDVDMSMIKDEFAQQEPAPIEVTAQANEDVNVASLAASQPVLVDKPKGKTSATRRSLAAPTVVAPKKKSVSVAATQKIMKNKNVINENNCQPQLAMQPSTTSNKENQVHTDTADAVMQPESSANAAIIQPLLQLNEIDAHVKNAQQAKQSQQSVKKGDSAFVAEAASSAQTTTAKKKKPRQPVVIERMQTRSRKAAKDNQ